MTRRILVCLLAGGAIAACARQTAPLRLLVTIALPGVRGRIDHFDYDLGGNRLFMSALGNDTVEVFNLRTGERIHTIGGLHEPQGVSFAPDSNRIFVANGGDGTCRVFDGANYKLLKTVHFPTDADDTRYDPATRRVYVGFGDEGDAGLGVLDAATGDLLATIQLPNHPESFQLEDHGPRIFVNLPSAGNVVAVVDRNSGRILARWTLGGAQGNFPMALDESDHRLFIACRDPAELIVLDTESGRAIARVRSAGHADDTWFDAKRKRVYISGGDGDITVIEQLDPSHYRRIAEFKTLPGGRTSCLVPELSRLYLGIWGRGGQPEELQVYGIEP